MEGALPENSIRQLYPPIGHTSNWVTTERMATKSLESFADRAVLPSHADR